MPRSQDGAFSELDPGLETAIAAHGARPETPQRLRVNLRWLLGTVLAGVTGSILMLLAAASSVDPRRSAVTSPQLVSGREAGARAPERSIVTARRGDKLVRKVDLIAASHSYKLPITVRSGNSEVVRVGSFTRVATTLAMDTLGFADAVPPFNLARLVAVASEDRAAEALPELEQDAEVALVTRDLDDRDLMPLAVQGLDESDILPQVTEAMAAPRRSPAGSNAQLLLANILREDSKGVLGNAQGFTQPSDDSFSKLVVRMVPENISVLAKIEPNQVDARTDERVATIRPDDPPQQILKRLGATPDQIRDIVRALTRGDPSALETNRRLKITVQPWEPGSPPAVVKVELYSDEERLAAIGRRDDGAFVPIEAARAAARSRSPAADLEEEDDEDAGGLPLFASIHETMRRHGVPATVIDQIVRVIFFDVDLQRRVTAGDSMEILVSNDEVDQARGELQMVAINIGGTKRRFFRYHLTREDVVEFFDELGRSAKQFLIRKPIDDGELRSTYGYRRHPILGYTRMHTGVDWANRVGTPIRAAGNGTVVKADWDSGYGRRIELEHNNGYMTTYSHLSAFAPGIREGARVRQGQVIGRLGSSGLSTGPHLHYEVMINGRFQDPLTIKLPRGRELAGPALADYRRERERIEEIIARAPGSQGEKVAEQQKRR